MCPWEFIPQPEYYDALKQLVDAGFGSRIMFGSDGGAKFLDDGVVAIENAPFLNAQQKRAILYDNAAKFFRLDPATAPWRTNTGASR
jgi:predicted TIM-barrel fold metal-dependent hydrolase